MSEFNKNNKVNNAVNSSPVYDDARKFFANALADLGEKNRDVLYISCDSSLGASGAEFNKKFPERHFEFGIAEQNAMGEAAGFAISGKIPFIAAYLPFVAYRCFEQVRDDVCKTNLNVNIMGNNCGFSVSALGATHTVLEDVAVMRALPNLTIFSPCDGPEYYQAVFAAAQIKGPVFIRVHRVKSRRIHKEGFKFEPGKGEILRPGTDITLVSCSSMVANTLDAADMLSVKGIDAEVINISTLKPIDRQLINQSSQKTKKVVTVEEHSVVGGLGGAVAEVLICESPVRMKMIGINDLFAVVGDYSQLIDYYGLSPEKIAGSVMDFLKTF
ncbi:MAG: transketolase family protein [Actinobacteria bacterium]|nr:transketolase family protein [Actinomycetota bacterium]